MWNADKMVTFLKNAFPSSPPRDDTGFLSKTGMGYRGTRDNLVGAQGCTHGVYWIIPGCSPGTAVSYVWTQFIHIISLCNVLMIYAFHQKSSTINLWSWNLMKFYLLKVFCQRTWLKASGIRIFQKTCLLMACLKKMQNETNFPKNTSSRPFGQEHSSRFLNWCETLGSESTIDFCCIFVEENKTQRKSILI